MHKIKFHTRLAEGKIESDLLNEFIGKEVEITIAVKPKSRKHQKKWSHLGSQNLGGKMDKVNIRDFTYE